MRFIRISCVLLLFATAGCSSAGHINSEAKEGWFNVRTFGASELFLYCTATGTTGVPVCFEPEYKLRVKNYSFK